jgi:hypothetical protein
MDEIQKIQVKNVALLKARNYLLNQTPSDPVVIAAVTESIVDLTGRHLAGVHVAEIPQVSVDEQRQLELVIGDLDKSIEEKAPAVEILKNSKGVFDLVPWPPEGFKIDAAGDIAPWPPKSMDIKDLKEWPPNMGARGLKDWPP